MTNKEFMPELLKSLRMSKSALVCGYLTNIQLEDEKEYEIAMNKFPDMQTENFNSLVLDIAFSKGKNHLWAETYCFTQYENIVDALKNPDPFLATVSIKEKCDEDKHFLVRLLAYFLNTEIEDLEYKNSDLTLFDYNFEGEMYRIKFTFLKKGTYDEIYYLDDLNQEVDIKIMTCLTKED